MAIREVGIGNYEISLCNPQGEELRRATRVATQRFPQIGDGFDLKGETVPYRVTDIRHVDQDTDTYEMFEHTELLVIARQDPSARRTEPHEPESRNGFDTDPTGKPRAHSVLNIIPFRPIAFDPTSPLAAFFWIVAGAILWGYKQQSHQLELLKFEAWQLNWSGKAWVLENLADGLSAAQLRALSREALREAVFVENFLVRVASTASAATKFDTTERSNNVIELASYRMSG